VVGETTRGGMWVGDGVSPSRWATVGSEKGAVLEFSSLRR